MELTDLVNAENTPNIIERYGKYLPRLYDDEGKLWCLANGIPQRLVTDSPFFYIALTMMLIGTQLFLAGFLGDLVSRTSNVRNEYQIEKKI